MKLRRTLRKAHVWKPSWDVWLEWCGDLAPVLPLLEFIVKRNSDRSGGFVDGSNLCDASWYFNDPRKARGLFDRLRAVLTKVRFSYYVRLRLLHDWKPGKEYRCVEIYRRGRLPKLRIRERAA